jgi:hypothetical protein
MGVSRPLRLQLRLNRRQSFSTKELQNGVVMIEEGASQSARAGGTSREYF